MILWFDNDKITAVRKKKGEVIMFNNYIYNIIDIISIILLQNNVIKDSAKSDAFKTSIVIA